MGSNGGGAIMTGNVDGTLSSYALPRGMRDNMKEALKRVPPPSILPPALKSKLKVALGPGYHQDSSDEDYSSDDGSDQSSGYSSRVSFPSPQRTSVSDEGSSYSSVKPTNAVGAYSPFLIEDAKPTSTTTGGWGVEGGISVHSGSWNQIFDEQERRGVIVLPLSKRGAEALRHLPECVKIYRGRARNTSDKDSSIPDDIVHFSHPCPPHPPDVSSVYEEAEEKRADQKGAEPSGPMTEKKSGITSSSPQEGKNRDENNNDRATVEDTDASKETEENGLDDQLNGETVEMKENITASDVGQKDVKENDDGVNKDVGIEKAAYSDDQELLREDLAVNKKVDEKKSEGSINNTTEAEDSENEKVDNLKDI